MCQLVLKSIRVMRRKMKKNVDNRIYLVWLFLLILLRQQSVPYEVDTPAASCFPIDRKCGE